MYWLPVLMLSLHFRLSMAAGGKVLGMERSGGFQIHTSEMSHLVCFVWYSLIISIDKDIFARCARPDVFRVSPPLNL